MIPVVQAVLLIAVAVAFIIYSLFTRSRCERCGGYMRKVESWDKEECVRCGWTRRLP